MSQIIYVNGRYLPRHEALVSCEDRGFLFGDGVYEVCEFYDGHIVEEARHLTRLARSLREIRLDLPMTEKALSHVMHETIRRNRVRHGFLYLEITRGAAKRDFLFPDPPVPPTVVCIVYRANAAAAEAQAQRGIAVKTMPDIRWQRPDIKTVLLLPSVLARQTAKEEGAAEAWYYDAAGFITEGAASNAWIITEDDRLITRQADTSILRGVTRQVVLDLLSELGLTLEERPFSLEEAHSAKEAFITSTTNLVMPVVRIDDRPIGTGEPGRITLALRKKIHDYVSPMPTLA